MQPLHFHNLFADLTAKEFTDCKFILGDESLVAHKNVLSCVSPVFKAMFYGELKEQGDVVIKDIEINVFRKLIWIIYGNSISIENAGEACQFYYAAKKYEISEALKFVRNYMKCNLIRANLDAFHETAKLFKDEEIVQNCFKTIEFQILNTTKHPDFFENTEPLKRDFSISFEAPQSELTADLEKLLKEYKQKLLAITSFENFVENDLATIRLLVKELKDLFELIVPKTFANFTCALESRSVIESAKNNIIRPPTIQFSFGSPNPPESTSVSSASVGSSIRWPSSKKSILFGTPQK